MNSYDSNWEEGNFQQQYDDGSSQQQYAQGYEGYGGGGYYIGGAGTAPPPQPYAPPQYGPPQGQQPPQQPPLQQAFGAAGFPASQFIQDPVIANAAMQYGQSLVGQGHSFVKQEIDKYMSVSKLKYYFAVDTQYVLKKMRLIFFPFTHSDWSVQFQQSEGVHVQPRHDVNAPDLYIPAMALVTYILMVGLSLGLMERFSPEMLGVQASSVLVWLVLEVLAVLAALHLHASAAVRPLHALHVLALAGYKFPGMIVALGAGLLLPGAGYWGAYAYCSAALALFMFRTLRAQLQAQDRGSSAGYSSDGSKRRFYLLAALTLVQPAVMWWLTQGVVYSRV